VTPTFTKVVNFETWSLDELQSDVDAFAAEVRRLANRVKWVFVPTWVVPEFSEHRPSIEMNSRVGASAALMRMNMRLAEILAATSNVVLFNTERWIRHGGPRAFNEKLWFLSKTPFSRTVFEEAARDMAATLHGIRGSRKKVLVIDLDNTLWGGVLGDVGWQSITLGGHEPIGEAYVEFQRQLLRLAREGIVLAIVSKNEEAVAMEAIDRHPEMVLRSSDFGGWRINWSDKAQNILDVISELNLGLDAAVFIDDSPHERSRIREALPDVLVPEWPTDPMDYVRALRSLRCFESPAFSSEDRGRTAMYVADRERKKLQLEFGSMEKWLEMLDLEMQAETLTASNLERTAQLLNKTNQMNLTTRRMSVQELAAWAAHENHQMWTFRVKDRIGDYGLCGIASLVVSGSHAELADFVLSCRAMGRGVEDAIVSIVAAGARRAGAETLSASYLATGKNAPCIRWIQQHSWFRPSTGSENSFELAVGTDLPLPEHIRVTVSAQ
jgi:FkbH-like protein